MDPEDLSFAQQLAADGLDGDALVVTTPAGSGKVKRLRHDPRVELRPSTRFGKVADDAPVVRGTAQVLDDELLLSRPDAYLKANRVVPDEHNPHRIETLEQRLRRLTGG